jgi:two-component system, sporulation sensor kinase E
LTTQDCEVIPVKEGRRKTPSHPTTRKREPKTQETGYRFDKIAEMGEDGIFVFDGGFNILFANQVASDITGIPKSDLIGKNFFSVIGKQDREFLEGTVIRGEGLGKKLCMEMNIFNPQGQLKEIDVCIASAKSEKSGVKIYAYVRDITVRKKYERDLKDSEERLRNLFERVRHGLFISSKEGKFLDCNQALIEMLHYSSKEMPQY